MTTVWNENKFGKINSTSTNTICFIVISTTVLFIEITGKGYYEDV